MSEKERKEGATPSKKPKAPARAPSSVTRKEPLVYVGPNLPTRGLVQFTIFRDGEVPAHVQALKDECPPMRSLFVGAGKLAAARVQLASAEINAIKAQYEAAQKHFAPKEEAGGK